MSWDHGMGEELQRTPKNCDKVSQCKVKGISGYPCSICQSHSHLLDFHELNEASNGSAGLIVSQGIALSKSALQDLPVGLHPRARRLVHPVFPNVLNTFFWKTFFFLHSFLLSFLSFFGGLRVGAVICFSSFPDEATFLGFSHVRLCATIGLH